MKQLQETDGEDNSVSDKILRSSGAFEFRWSQQRRLILKSSVAWRTSKLGMLSWNPWFFDLEDNTFSMTF